MPRAVRTFTVKAPMKREDWQDASRYGGRKNVSVRVGYASELDDGSILVTLNVVPVGPRWDGTLKLYDNAHDEHKQQSD